MAKKILQKAAIAVATCLVAFLGVSYASPSVENASSEGLANLHNERYEVAFMDGNIQVGGAYYTEEDSVDVTWWQPLTSQHEGYTFVGWTDEEGNLVTEIPKGSSGNRTLTAAFVVADDSASA